MRSEQQLRTFIKVLNTYPADRPITKFLPDFFKKNKQMGSTDRRSASRLLYNYFRLGRALSEKTIEQRLFLAEFLCSASDNPFLQHFLHLHYFRLPFNSFSRDRYSNLNFQGNPLNRLRALHGIVQIY